MHIGAENQKGSLRNSISYEEWKSTIKGKNKAGERKENTISEETRQIARSKGRLKMNIDLKESIDRHLGQNSLVLNEIKRANLDAYNIIGRQNQIIPKSIFTVGVGTSGSSTLGFIGANCNLNRTRGLYSSFRNAIIDKSKGESKVSSGGGGERIAGFSTLNEVDKKLKIDSLSEEEEEEEEEGERKGKEKEKFEPVRTRDTQGIEKSKAETTQRQNEQVQTQLQLQLQQRQIQLQQHHQRQQQQLAQQVKKSVDTLKDRILGLKDLSDRSSEISTNRLTSSSREGMVNDNEAIEKKVLDIESKSEALRAKSMVGSSIQRNKDLGAKIGTMSKPEVKPLARRSTIGRVKRDKENERSGDEERKNERSDGVGREEDKSVKTQFNQHEDSLLNYRKAIKNTTSLSQEKPKLSKFHENLKMATTPKKGTISVQSRIEAAAERRAVGRIGVPGSASRARGYKEGNSVNHEFDDGKSVVTNATRTILTTSRTMTSRPQPQNDASSLVSFRDRKLKPPVDGRNQAVSRAREKEERGIPLERASERHPPTKPNSRRPTLTELTMDKHAKTESSVGTRRVINKATVIGGSFNSAISEVGKRNRTTTNEFKKFQSSSMYNPSSTTAASTIGRMRVPSQAMSTIGTGGGGYSSSMIRGRHSMSPRMNPRSPIHPRYADINRVAEPLTPEQVLRMYKAMLSKHEAEEIKNYQNIYFIRRANLRIPPRGQTNDGFDDSEGDYIVQVGDQLEYRYEIVQMMGKGSFGQVVKAIDHKTGSSVAVKIIRCKSSFHNQALIEVGVLEFLNKNDPNGAHHIVKVIESFAFRQHLCIVTELLNMNLYDWLKANYFLGSPTVLLKHFSKQMIECLVLLANQHVIHCDLKPENILLSAMPPLPPSRRSASSLTNTPYHPANSSAASSLGVRTQQHPMAPAVLQRDIAANRYAIKVIDFGSSCFESKRIYTYIQSRFYRSPEVILGLPYGPPIDMWSTGCIIYELFTGSPLFPGENERDQLLCIAEVIGLPPAEIVANSPRKLDFAQVVTGPNGESLYALKSYTTTKGRKRSPNSKPLDSLLARAKDPLFLDFVSNCLVWDPDFRMTPNQAINHPWLS